MTCSVGCKSSTRSAHPRVPASAIAISFATPAAIALASTSARAQDHDATIRAARVVDANRPIATTAPPAVVQPARPSPLDQAPIHRPAEDGAAITSAPSGGGDHASQPAPNLDVSRVVIALALVIGLILLLRWLGRRFFASPAGARSSRAVKVLSRAPFSPKQHVVLMQVGKRVLVVADNGQQLSSLAEISDADEVAALLGQLREESAVSPVKAFSSLFNRFSAGSDGVNDEAAEPVDAHTGSERADATGAGQRPESAAVAATRAELGSLMERIRLVSRQFERS